jgi:hypothetical protein
MQTLTLRCSCLSEERVCLAGAGLDFEATSEASIWHSICDTAISFKPTTPVISTITEPLDPRCGDPLETACGLASDALDDCQLSYSAPGQASLQLSCYCQQSVLAEAFTCEYIGNLTCYNDQVNTQLLYGNGLCSNFPAFFSSMLTQVCYRGCYAMVNKS